MTDEFKAALDRFMKGAQKIVNEHYARDFPNLTVPTLKISEGGRKSLRIYKETLIKDSRPSLSAWAFIDVATGDVLKPDGWKKPAKHARGNLYDEHNGLGLITVTGPAYLR